MKPSTIIRNYQSKDIDSCRELWKELTEWHREIYQDPSIGGEHPENFFDKHLAEIGPDQIWVAVDDSRVVGLVGLITKGNEAEIEPVIVTSSYRGNGIGTQLLESAITAARGKGARFLTVKPVARNLKTIQFLHKHGFKNIGFIELFIDFSKRPWKSQIELFDCEFEF